MSSRLIIKRSTGDRSPKTLTRKKSLLRNIQVLPFAAETPDGRPAAAPVDVYFHPYCRPVAADAPASVNDPATVWSATFRGRLMNGVRVPTPDGYTGVLCSVSGEDLVAEEDFGQVAKHVVYWNWDKSPTDEDPLLSAFNWTRVSEALMS